LHGLVVGDNTDDRQVATGGVLRHSNGFRFGNGTQEWNLPLLVAVNAHAKVDLGGSGIGVKCFVEAQDWIAWCHFDSGEQAHFCGSSIESGGTCSAPAECTRAVHKRGASIEAITARGDSRNGFSAKFFGLFTDR